MAADTHETLVDPRTLSVLSTRNDGASIRRLLVHLACISAALLAAAITSGTWWSLLPTLVLAFLLGTLFAPFHESTHGTAFATPAYNRWVAALTGVLIAVPWRGYRVLHFEHHAHTQDPERDPEIMTDPQVLSPWPDTPLQWVVTLSGVRILWSRLSGLVSCWMPGPSARFAALPPGGRADARIASVFWIAVAAGALWLLPGALELALAFALSHVVLGVWLTTEHTGCADHGDILDRARSVRSNAVARFFLWNMNYHGEHHGWPAVPWHALPDLHFQLGRGVQIRSGYGRVYRDLIHARR